MKTPMNQKNTEHPRERADRQVVGLAEVSTIQIRRVDCFLMNKQVQGEMECIRARSTGIVQGALELQIRAGITGII